MSSTVEFRDRQSPGDPGSGRDRQTTIHAVTVIDVSENNMLGDYLRARRELIQPDSVGLPVNGIRRVAGLRREEVAMLAGISSDYYLRLEQGRDRNPSIQVLEALARILRLDQAATDYLLGLATPRPRHRRRRPRRETVPAGIRQLLDIFDPAEKALYPGWDHATARLVAGFRSPSEPMPTHVSSSSSANCRCPANDSDGSRPGTTFSLAKVCRPASTTLKSGTSRSAARSSPSAVPRVSCSLSTTPNPASAAPKRWLYLPPGQPHRYGRPRRDPRATDIAAT
jgi:transcriptional regulator with XRE-family HTH domain